MHASAWVSTFLDMFTVIQSITAVTQSGSLKGMHLQGLSMLWSLFNSKNSCTTHLGALLILLCARAVSGGMEKWIKKETWSMTGTE